MANNPVSLPVVPAQPNQELYSVQDLALFKTYSRDSYRTTFGLEAPAYDPARVLKSWFDSTVDVSDPGNVAVYRVVAQDQNGNGILRQMVMPAQEAATVNLPGAIQYPAYVVAPTLATRGGSTLNAIYLSLESDARALMKELGGSNLQQEDLPSFPATYPGDEPRRQWYFLVQGQACQRWRTAAHPQRARCRSSRALGRVLGAAGVGFRSRGSDRRGRYASSPGNAGSRSAAERTAVHGHDGNSGSGADRPPEDRR